MLSKYTTSVYRFAGTEHRRTRIAKTKQNVHEELHEVTLDIRESLHLRFFHYSFGLPFFGRRNCRYLPTHCDRCRYGPRTLHFLHLSVINDITGQRRWKLIAECQDCLSHRTGSVLSMDVSHVDCSYEIYNTDERILHHAARILKESCRLEGCTRCAYWV
jgi:Zn-finger protein